MSTIAIIVADSAHAKFFLKAGKNAPLEEIIGWINQRGRDHERDLVTSRPGRTLDRQGGALHSMDPRTSTKTHQAMEFAKHLSLELEKYAAQGKFKQLIIIAAPKFLGMIRQHLSPNIKQKIIYEVDKNATLQDARSLSQRVQKLYL